MPPDAIQIGPFIISKPAFDVLATLVSVITGGLITYLTTRSMENKKWEQQKKDKLQEQRREAIGLALEWLAPIDEALMRGSAAARAFMHKSIDRDTLVKGWPELSITLARKDIPARLQVLLSPSTYRLISEIIEQLANLQFTSLRSDPEKVESAEEWIEKARTIDSQALHIRNLEDTLRKELIEEYKKTFK